MTKIVILLAGLSWILIPLMVNIKRIYKYIIGIIGLLLVGIGITNNNLSDALMLIIVGAPFMILAIFKKDAFLKDK